MLGKITKNGRVTIPKSIRIVLGIGPGDKVIFVENELGDLTMQKLVEAQPATLPTSPTSN